MNLEEMLLQSGKVTAERLAAARSRAESEGGRRSASDILVEEGHIQPADVLIALGEMHHIDVALTLGDAMIDPSLVEHVPVDWARKFQVLPVRWQGSLAAAIADAAALPRINELTLLMDAELEPLLAPPDEIRRAIDQAYFERNPSGSPAGTAAEPGAEEIVQARADDLLRGTDAAPVTGLLNGIILNAVKKKASDIHIEPFENRLRVRFRIDGVLYEQEGPPKSMESSLTSRIKVMGRLDIAEKRLPQDGMAKVRAGEREIDIRISTVPIAEGERVVLRLLNQSSTLLPLDQLGMPAPLLARFDAVKDLPNGIVLVTGPTGSGKTTTLYAALRGMDTHHRNVLTIEDPIEYQIPDIGQIQVKPKIGLTFASGLRHILRQDPDVILVGEIRDQETAEIAARAALTGHLVFSTLHTNDAVSAVVRLADMGIPPYLIAASTRCILAQRLVRKLCPHCSRATTFSETDLVLAPSSRRSALAGCAHRVPVGCPACTQGYRDRIGIYELFMIGEPEQQVIRGGMDLRALRELARGQGLGMWDDAERKIRDGVTSLEEVRRVLEADGPGSER